MTPQDKIENPTSLEDLAQNSLNRHSTDDLFTIETADTVPINKKESNRTVVRLTTSYWHDRNGVYERKNLTFLRRKSKGDFNILEEDCDMSGADLVIKRITNLHDLKDGIYSIETCNEFGGWETPHIIEDYDYKLVEYKD